MNILLTGGTGVLGRRLNQLLQKRGHRIILAVRQGKLLPNSVEINPWKPFSVDLPIDLVVHLANFYPQIENGAAQVKTIDTNIGLASSVSSYCYQSGVPILSVGTFLEKNQTRPFSHYSESKIAARRLIRNFALAGKYSHLHVYLYDSYSEDLSRNKFIDILLSSPDLESFQVNRPHYLQDLTHVDDICHALALESERLVRGVNIYEETQVRSKEVFSLGRLTELVSHMKSRQIIEPEIFFAEYHAENNKISDCAKMVPGWKQEIYLVDFLHKYFS